VSPSSQGVAVFAPAPKVTVTVEQALEGGAEVHFHAGGQGFWVARMVAGLGLPVTLCAAFGGEAGLVARVLIEHEGVTVRSVVAPTRVTGAYVHDRRSGEREPVAEMEGMELDRHHLDDLYGATLVAGLDAGVCVLTGQDAAPHVPADMFRRLAADLRDNGARVVADLSDENLAEAVKGGVDVLKVAHNELVRSGWAEGEDPAQLVDGIRRLRDAGAAAVIVSRADEPALAAVGEQVLWIEGPRVEAVDARGSGDSMTAALAVGLATGMSVEDALRLATAAGGLNATRRGLATGDRREIQRLAAHATVRPY